MNSKKFEYMLETCGQIAKINGFVHGIRGGLQEVTGIRIRFILFTNSPITWHDVFHGNLSL